MSTVAIDNARTNERLSAFLSEIGADKPIDQFFPERPLLERLLANKKMQNGGRQILYPINIGKNPTVKDFSDYDLFDTQGSDTSTTVTYAFKNKGGSLVISWEEKRETAGQDHSIFNLVEHKRNVLMETVMDDIATDLMATTQGTGKITAIPLAVDSTGSLGGLDASAQASWAAKEVGSGSFATQGLSDMRSLYNQISEDGGAPDTVVMNRTIYDFYENEIDPDVRYAVAQGTGGRGFKTLEFKGMPIILEKKSVAGNIFMIDSSKMFFVVDTEGNFTSDEFQTPTNQKSSVSKLTFRANNIVTRRKSHGKLTGVIA